MVERHEPTSREKILEVAEALFARSGFAGVGLRELADRSGLGKSSLFHHFRSKGHLYLEVLRTVLERIQERLAPVIRSQSGPAEKLPAWVEALIDALAEHPNSARLLLRALFEDDDFPEDLEPQAQEVEGIVMSILGTYQAIVQQGIDLEIFQPVSVTDATQTMIGATVYHFASGEIGEAVTGGPIFAAAAIQRRRREVVHFLIGGLTADPTH
ncbi:MAG: TetR/AcrR family transcriptional regulator [Proteobacteria bacterium]|nr:TetR/AcrR family transcriptional regulator [Pseudomonadota bacterium]